MQRLELWYKKTSPQFFLEYVPKTSCITNKFLEKVKLYQNFNEVVLVNPFWRSAEYSYVFTRKPPLYQLLFSIVAILWVYHCNFIESCLGSARWLFLNFCLKIVYIWMPTSRQLAKFPNSSPNVFLFPHCFESIHWEPLRCCIYISRNLKYNNSNCFKM